MISRPIIWLLGSATVLSLVSLCFPFFVQPKSLIAQILIGYIPILLGCIAMWLCLRARKKARHKALVILYAILLAPFAFYYPVAVALAWASYVSGGRGPFP